MSRMPTEEEGDFRCMLCSCNCPGTLTVVTVVLHCEISTVIAYLTV